MGVSPIRMHQYYGHVHRKISGEKNIVRVCDPCGGVLGRLCVPYSASLLQAIRIE